MSIFYNINIIFIGACVNEVVYPQQRIADEEKTKIRKEIEEGKYTEADYEIQRRSKFTKILKFKRPQLNKDDTYNDD